jgi:hypothetical protein
MTPGALLRAVREVPVARWPAEALWRLRRRRWIAQQRPPTRSAPAAEAGGLPHLLPAPRPALDADARAVLENWCEHYLRGEFDLLGSGWRKAGGDWSTDFKSGHRWSAAEWHRVVRIEVDGADVKVPWELARMQHLPQLALAALAGILPAGRAAQAFRDDVGSFLAANPPGWGVNWTNAMEVALRAANWLIAWDLLGAAGARFDDAFTAALRGAVRAHGRHIAENLEWHPRYRGNHYLADLAGLAMCGAWLDDDEADGWLAFGVRGMEEECARQFNADGSGFEGSTCYHRLSGEIVAWATAVARALPASRLARLAALRPRPLSPQHGLFAAPAASSGEPFAPAHFERLRRIARFTLAAMKPGGRIAQIGDNDSGRFARLSWGRNAGDALDHRCSAAALLALVGEGEGGGYDAAIFAQLARRAPASAPVAPDAGSAGWDEALRDAGPPVRSRVLARGPGLAAGLTAAAFPDFGLYVLRSDRLWLGVRCGEAGLEPLGAHAHNDQLAIELAVDGKEVVRDPGSYVYTPRAERDAYRAASAHDVPRLEGREPASLADGTFLLRERTGARCLHFSRRGFVGLHRGYGAPVWRAVSLTDEELRVDDFSAAGELAVPGPQVSFSAGYGEREA